MSVKLLRELQNDNVVRLEDIFVDTVSKELVIAFEYAEYDLLVRDCFGEIERREREERLGEIGLSLPPSAFVC